MQIGSEAGPEAPLATVRLRRFTDQEAERRHLIERLRGDAPPTVDIPVLDEGDLLDQVTEWLRATGRRATVTDDGSEALGARCAEADAGSATEQRLRGVTRPGVVGHGSSPDGTTAGREPSPAAPSLIVASEAVDEGVVLLAQVLCCAQRVSLADLHALDGEALARVGRRGALMLVPECPAAPGPIYEALRIFARAGLGCGLLCLPGPMTGRWRVIRAFLSVDLPARGDRAVFATGFLLDGEEAAPPCIRRDEAIAADDFLACRSDVAVLSGHSNGLDFAAGSGLLLCSRAETSRATGTRVFPCCHDGQCFRQAAFGRDPAGTDGLVSPSAAQVGVLILSGCNLVALGRSWFDPGRGLVAMALRARCHAVIAATSLVPFSREHEFLLLALIAEGVPLGEAVARANRARQPPADLGSHGPFLLFGNPSARQTTPTLARVLPESWGVDWITLRLPRAALAAEGGLMVKVLLPDGLPAIFPEVSDNPSGLWCLGVVERVGQECALYLWLHAPSSNGADPRLTVHLRRAPRREGERVALRAVLSEAPFWHGFLGEYLPERPTAKAEFAAMEPLRGLLPDSVTMLWRGLSGLQQEPDLVVGREQHEVRSAVLEESLAVAAQLSGWCAEFCTELAARKGTLQFHAWKHLYRRTGRFDSARTCTCGGGRVWAEVYEAQIAGPGRRAIYQCDLCGPLGEDDARELLAIADTVTQARRGGRLVRRCSLRAPRGEAVLFHLAAVLEIWDRRRICRSEVEGDLLAPGARVERKIALDIPLDITPGLYPYAIVGTVNGSLTLTRQMIEVTA